MDTLKTLYNLGQNLDTTGSIPGYKVVEKQKDYEIRKYYKNKYIALRLNTESENGKNKVNDSITKQIWRIMKYTQGDNEKKRIMKLHLPVIVNIDDVLDDTQNAAKNDDNKKTTVKIMVSLPIEFQTYEEGANEEPPKPNDPELFFEELEEITCYVKTFSGFANDTDFQRETKKLAELLEAGKVKYIKEKVLCLSYDGPTKLFNRRNEVMLIQSVA